MNHIYYHLSLHQACNCERDKKRGLNDKDESSNVFPICLTRDESRGFGCLKKS